MLAAIGVPRPQLVDFDQVDITNVTTQGYCAGDVGITKASPRWRQSTNSIRLSRLRPWRIATGTGCRLARPFSAAWTPSTPSRPSGARQAKVPLLV